MTFELTIKCMRVVKIKAHGGLLLLANRAEGFWKQVELDCFKFSLKPSSAAGNNVS